jgi:2',3'-cyclic-nucleotide 2'-phosphodiesterase (5'-nucleotidase family)
MVFHELSLIGKDVIGSADAVLFRSREGESNIGNLVTDAMVWAHRWGTVDTLVWVQR